jgi:hypothetical protein
LKVRTLDGSALTSVIQEERTSAKRETAAITARENPSARIMMGPAMPLARRVNAAAAR